MHGSARRLSAIVFTDIVGFTALTQANEARALALLEEHNRLLRPIFPRYHGTEVKTMGDSFLVEFDSALEATRCAVEIQRSLWERNRDLPEAEALRLRIGVHLGDVVRTGNDVLGDAVNVASRIEPFAEPGGVCVSQQVFDQVRNKLEQPLLRLGTPELKNVQFPVDVYRVELPWAARPSPVAATASLRRMAVLPLSNMSPDPQDEYFAEGLTEEMIAELSKLRGLGVIARTSVMRYKNSTKSILEIGRELHVDQVLEGSVRKSGQRIRITAQLIDARTEEHLWADRYDRDLTDIFAVQSEIAASVARALDLQFRAPALGAHPPTRDVEAHTLYLQGRHLWSTRGRAETREAVDRFEQAIARDPSYAQAYAGLADAYMILADTWAIPVPEALAKARAAADRALAIDPTLAEAHASLGMIRSSQRSYADAEAAFRRAIDLSPGYAMAHHWYSLLLAAEGRFEESAREAKLSEAADPLSPAVMLNVGFWSIVEGRAAEAVAKLERAIEFEPHYPWLYFAEVAALVEAGRKEDARALLSRFQALAPKDSEQETTWAVQAQLAASVGDREAALRYLQPLEAQGKGEPRLAFPVAMVYATLEDLDRAFEWLNLDIDAGGSGHPWTIRPAPQFKALRADPRFEQYLRRLGLVPMA